MNLFVGAAFAIILGALILAGVFMVRGGGDEGAKKGRMMHALTVRIAVSVVLFVCILVAWRLGWIHPTGLPVGR